MIRIVRGRNPSLPIDTSSLSPPINFNLMEFQISLTRGYVSQFCTNELALNDVGLVIQSQRVELFNCTLTVGLAMRGSILVKMFFRSELEGHRNHTFSDKLTDPPVIAHVTQTPNSETIDNQNCHNLALATTSYQV